MLVKIQSSVVLICFLSLLGYPSFAQKNNSTFYHDNIVIVKLKPKFKYLTDKKSDFILELKSVIGNETQVMFDKEYPFSKEPTTQFNKSGAKMIDITGICRITYSADIDPLKLASQLAKMPYFEYAEPLYKVELLYVPNDPMNQTDQYWLTNVHSFEAWDVCQGDTNIVIGISDTGIELSHPELVYQIKYNYDDMPDGIDNDLDGYIDNFRGWNFGENNNNVQADVHYHGSWVGGIAGAATDDGIGVSGAGFKCKILPIKIMNAEGVLVNVYQSIVYAAEHGCDVLNCSWGGDGFQQMAQDVINYATNNFDMLVVAAAGNTNSDTKFFPSSYENVLSVAGTNQLDQKWSPDNSPSTQGSSYSYFVDVCAPATSFKTTGALGDYAYMYGGTSFASPIVAGSAGILRSYFPDYTANQIAELIKSSADVIDTIEYNLPFADKLGKGRLNLYNALTMEQTPAVYFHNYTISEEDGVVTINGDFTNYLSDAENLVISLELVTGFASLENYILFSGTLNTMDAYVSENQIIINTTENIPYDYKIILKFNYVADSYISDQIIEFYVNPGFVDVETDKLLLSVAPGGRFGYSDIGSSIGNGFNYSDLSTLFYDCGIISGTSATRLYSSVRQVTDFDNFVYPYYVDDSGIADYHVRSEITDYNDLNPIGLHIIQDVYSWSGAENQNFVIVDFHLFNSSIYDIENFYFGLFADWDLVDPSKNTVRLDALNNFMYAQSENNQTMYAGFKLLSNQSVRNYAVPQVEGGDGIIDITSGFIDIEKFYMISNSNLGYVGEPKDVVAYTGAGPFDIHAGDTITVGMAFIAGESMYNISNALVNSQAKYDDILHPQVVEVYENLGFMIFPNPAGDLLNIGVQGNSNFNYSVAIYNSLGESIFSENLNGKSQIDLMSFKSGIYSVKITYEGKVIVRKLVIAD